MSATEDEVQVTPLKTLHIGDEFLLAGEPVLVDEELAKKLAVDGLVVEAGEILGNQPAVQPKRRVVGAKKDGK